MSSKPHIIYRIGFGACFAVLVVLSILTARQNKEVERLETTVRTLESKPCPEPAPEPCACEPESRLLSTCTSSLKIARERLKQVKTAAASTSAASPDETAASA